MVFDWATSGPYSGGTVTLVDTYQGYDIYYLNAVPVYGIVDPDGVERKPYPSTIAAAYELIDDWTGEEPPVDGNGTAALGGLGLLILLYLIFTEMG